MHACIMPDTAAPGWCMTSPTLETGFMMAASAEMGLRVTALPAERSTMVTFCWSAIVSHVTMNLSDSSVVLPNLMASGFTPRAVKSRSSISTIGCCAMAPPSHGYGDRQRSGGEGRAASFRSSSTSRRSSPPSVQTTAEHAPRATRHSQEHVCHTSLRSPFVRRGPLPSA